VLAALEALQTLDLLQVRHENGVRRIFRQLHTDVERLASDQRDALAAANGSYSDGVRSKLETSGIDVIAPVHACPVRPFHESTP
jgi:hypothetical protein